MSSMGKTKTALFDESKKDEKKPNKTKRVKHVEAGTETKVDESPERTVEKEKAIKVRSKKYKEAKSQIDRNKKYEISDAIKLARETSYVKFDGSLEMHFVIKKTGFSTSISLPHTFGKEKKVEIVSDETVKKLKEGKIDFDVLLATPDMMPKIVPFARLLGPKGLMPNPKNGTLIKNAKDAQNFSTGAITMKTEKEAPVVHMVAGKLSMKDEDLKENIKVIMDSLGKNQIVKAYIAPTMGPSIKLAV